MLSERSACTTAVGSLVRYAVVETARTAPRPARAHGESLPTPPRYGLPQDEPAGNIGCGSRSPIAFRFGKSTATYR